MGNSIQFQLLLLSASLLVSISGDVKTESPLPVTTGRSASTTTGATGAGVTKPTGKTSTLRPETTTKAKVAPAAVALSSTADAKTTPQGTSISVADSKQGTVAAAAPLADAKIPYYDEFSKPLPPSMSHKHRVIASITAIGQTTNEESAAPQSKSSIHKNAETKTSSSNAKVIHEEKIDPILKQSAGQVDVINSEIGEPARAFGSDANKRRVQLNHQEFAEMLNAYGPYGQQVEQPQPPPEPSTTTTTTIQQGGRSFALEDPTASTNQPVEQPQSATEACTTTTTAATIQQGGRSFASEDPTTSPNQQIEQPPADPSTPIIQQGGRSLPPPDPIFTTNQQVEQPQPPADPSTATTVQQGGRSLPIADAIEDLKEKGYEIESVPNDNNSIYITLPDTTTKPAAMITTTTKRAAVDPPTVTLSKDAQQKEQQQDQYLVTSPLPPVKTANDLEPHCPTLSQFISASQKMWNGITQAGGIKNGLGIFFSAAADAISTLTLCAKKIIGEIGSLLFNTAFGSGSSESSSNQNQTDNANNIVKNIKTMEGRSFGNQEVNDPNDTVIQGDSKQESNDTSVPIDLGSAQVDSGSLQKKRHHRRLAAPRSLRRTSADVVLAGEEAEHVEDVVQIDVVDPAMYQ